MADPLLTATPTPYPSTSLSHVLHGRAPTRRRKRETAMLVVKWGLVDAVFFLSFVPLLYLVKQWSY